MQVYRTFKKRAEEQQPEEQYPEQIVESMTPKIYQKRIIINDINSETTADFIKSFYEIEDTGQEIIPIYINSCGGGLEDSLAIVDVIRCSTAIVPTVAIGRAYSGGSLILAAGAEGYRYVSPNSTIMIHDIAAGFGGKTHDILNTANEIARLDKVLFTMMDNFCKQEIGYFKKMLKDRQNTDWYLSPDEAVEQKIADHVKLPTFRLGMHYEYFLS